MGEAADITVMAVDTDIIMEMPGVKLGISNKREKNSSKLIISEAFMKKLGLVMVIAFLAIGTASAQNWGNGWASQAISVTGTLQLRNGEIAVVSGNNAYFVPALTRYIGFIEGLREGAQISMTGFASGNYIQPTSVTANGKTYDFNANVPQGGVQGTPYGGYGWGHHNGANGWGGGMGHHGGGYGRRW